MVAPKSPGRLPKVKAKVKVTPTKAKAKNTGASAPSLVQFRADERASAQVRKPGTPRVLTNRQNAAALVTQRAGERASAVKKTPVTGGGIDLPKFASEVSRNYAKGVAQVGGNVDRTIKGIRADLVSRGRGVGIGRDNGIIDRAMKTGADKSNPLHRLLGNNKGK
jgi:hypothetical protein